MMAGLGMTPEETCVHSLFRHRLPLQSQVKSSVPTQTLQSLLGWQTLLWHTQWEQMECGGTQKVCKNSCSTPVATPVASLGHQPLADTTTLQRRTQVAHTGLGHTRPRAPGTCLSSGCLWVPLQCQALLGTRSLESRTDCKW